MTFRPFISASQIPSQDNEFTLGRHDRRWADGYFGPGSVHIVSTAGESGVPRDWTLEIENDGYFAFAEDGTTIISLSPDGYLIATSGIVFADGSRFTSAAGIGAIDPNSISDLELRDSVGLSVIGRSLNSTGDPGDIVAGIDGYILRRSGSALEFGTISTAGISANAVTNQQLTDMATLTIKGRSTAGTGDPEDLTAAQVTAMLNVFTSLLRGLVPASGGSSSDFLRADGYWAAPIGSGDVVGPVSATDNAVVRFDGYTGDLIQNSAVLITDAGEVGAGNGTAALPAYSFTSDPNTGIFSPGADQVGVSTGGTERVRFQTSNTLIQNQLVHTTGTAATPAVAFNSESTGTYQSGAGNWDVSVSGSQRLNVTGSWISAVGVPFLGGGGTAANPQYSFGGDQNTGIYSLGTDSLGISGGGVALAGFTPTEAVFNEAGGSIDFRVEGDGYSNLIFVDASVDAVGIRNSTPLSVLDVAGSIGAAIATITAASATLDATYHTVLADATSNAITINLPTATSSARRIYSVKKTDATANIVTIDASGSEVIDDATTYALSVQHDSVIIQSNGTKWYIIAEDGYVSATGAGDVVGPTSSTDNAVARFDAATGKLLQNSSVLITDAGAVGSAAGTALLPAYSFSGDPNTGVWNSAADSVSVTTGGVTRLTMSTTAVTSTLPILATGGSEGAPGIAFSADEDTGISWSGSDALVMSTGGVARGTMSSTAWTTTVRGLGAAGTAPLPQYSFSADPDTGIYNLGVDSLGISGGGTALAAFTLTGSVFNDDGYNIDFRVEGDGYAHLIFADASVDFVGIRNSEPASTLDVVGSLGVAITTITAASATLDATHHTVAANAVSNAITINLPAAASATRRIYIIKKTDSSANAVTVDADAAETIDGATTYVMTTQYQSVTIQSTGTNWWIL